VSQHCPDPENLCPTCKGYQRALDSAWLALGGLDLAATPENLAKLFRADREEETESEPGHDAEADA
jgi:hypothetical protein